MMEPDVGAPVLRLLHLSDIHFCQQGPDATDIELAVRKRMLSDIAYMRSQTGDMEAVLVVGDIASTGKVDEYNVAAAFLDETCALIGASPDRVVCVPGNHDIDRTLHGPMHATVRHQLRSIDPRGISDVLRDLLEDELGAETLSRPLTAYNDFALAYTCAIGPGAWIWAPKILKLGEREVHLHGVTSAWICDAKDSFESDSDRVVAGLFQLAPVGEDPEAVSIVLCHHPMRWLRDREQVEPWFAQAQLILTGHEHEARAALSDNGRSVKIASGAVNPPRKENEWIPAYNVIELTPAGEARLLVRIFSRSWQHEVAEFGPDEEDAEVQKFLLPLTPSDHAIAFPPIEVVDSPEPEPFVSDDRAKLYRIMRASPNARLRAGRELGLIPDDPECVGLKADRELLRKAVQEAKLGELEERIYG